MGREAAWCVNGMIHGDAGRAGGGGGEREREIPCEGHSVSLTGFI